jgi:hypothetical protein
VTKTFVEGKAEVEEKGGGKKKKWAGYFFLSFGTTALQWAMASSFTRFLDHKKRRTTVGRTSLDE